MKVKPNATYIIYARVSSDEQSFGGSLDDQIFMATKFVQYYSGSILEIFKEDYSSKNGFDRPEFNKLLKFIKKAKPDYIIFKDWKRFGRDIFTALPMVKQFLDLDIIPNAYIPGQWIDYSTPYYLDRLSRFLSDANIDNLFRSLDVKKGNRGKLRKGIFPYRLPKKYYTRTKVNNELHVELTENVDEIKQFFEKVIELNSIPGAIVNLNCSFGKKRAYDIIKKKIWCSRYDLPENGKPGEYDFEPAEEIKLQLPQIISYETWLRANKVISGPKQLKKITAFNPKFPLKDKINCPICNQKVFASTSKGRSKYYNYYHCREKSHFYYNKELINASIIEFLKQFQLSELDQAIIYEQITHLTKSESKLSIINKANREKQKLQAQLNSLNEKFLQEETFDFQTYSSFKIELQNKINSQNDKIENAKSADRFNWMELIEKITEIATMYELCTPKSQYELINQIFLNNITFSGSRFSKKSGLLKINSRTTQLSPTMQYFQAFHQKNSRTLQKSPALLTKIQFLEPPTKLLKLLKSVA